MKKVIAYADHGTADMFTRYRFEIDLGPQQFVPASSAGGRIVVEFPI
jgi:hypothetical protein